MVQVVQEEEKVQVIPIPKEQVQFEDRPNSGVDPDWQQVLQQEQLQVEEQEQMQVEEQVHQQEEQVGQVEGG